LESLKSEIEEMTTQISVLTESNAELEIELEKLQQNKKSTESAVADAERLAELRDPKLDEYLQW
jgi:regulator of replication initiation timing